MPPPLRRQLLGAAEIEVALAAADGYAGAVGRAAREAGTLRLILARRGATGARERAVCERARARGVPVRETSAADLWRMSRDTPPPDLLGLTGADPHRDAAALLAGHGPVWTLVGVAYPGNAGAAIRTAEVSGAAGITLDVPFDAAARRRALRFAMGAERFFPVLWEPAQWIVSLAREAGRTVLAVEDSGTRAPWQVDLRGAPLFLLGGERGGIPAPLLAGADAVLRLPMPGFIPAYNLQAALAAVAAERLRQLDGPPASPHNPRALEFPRERQR